MHIIKECEICGKLDRHNNFVIFHPIRYYYGCEDCAEEVCLIKDKDEQRDRVYIRYKAFGIKEINIPRSSGAITPGNIIGNNSNCITLTDYDIIFPVEFFDGRQFEKRINLINAKKNNFHFPLYQIIKDQLDVSENNRKLQTLCLLNNNAIKLFISGNRDNDCLLCKLPWDMIKYIIKCYYTKINFTE